MWEISLLGKCSRTIEVRGFREIAPLEDKGSYELCRYKNRFFLLILGPQKSDSKSHSYFEITFLVKKGPEGILIK